MKITEHIERSSSTLFSFEILPPKKGENIHTLFSNIDPLMEFNPPFIDVTYHREEQVFKETAQGLRKLSIRKRPGTVGICAAIKNKYDVDAVPHIICGGFTKEQTEEALIDLDFLGIENILLLRGDPAKGEETFNPVEGGHRYASGLVEQVCRLNRGIYLDEEQTENAHTNFCLGIAAYPEKHFESTGLAEDLDHLKKKVESGADYIVTQMFFDNEKYFNFVEKCRQKGIDVPIIPGIKPIAIQHHLTLLPEIFNITLPQGLLEEAKKCTTNGQFRSLGVEWAINQCKELMNYGVPVLHFYSMGKSDNIYQIAKTIF